MRFKEFNLKLKESLCGTQIRHESAFHGHSIIEAVDGSIFVDYKRAHFLNLEEAKESILNDKFEEEIAQELYEEIPAVKIASLIREHHDIKITDTLIESYISLASSKTFSVDPVVAGIRSLNSVDSLIEGKIDYVLEDGSSVAIDKDTQEVLNSLLEDKYQLVEYMRESKQNFMHVVKELS